jgi:tetratricopeptide (TPR) repeat protein
MRAIELDPLYAEAYGMAAHCYAHRKSSAWITDHALETAEAVRLARRAAELGKDNANALCPAAWAIAFMAGDLDTGAALINLALALNPNLASAWHVSGGILVLLGAPEVTIKHSSHAMRLSPYDPLIDRMQNAIATAHFFAGRYDEASSHADKVVRSHSHNLPAVRIAAASHALAGRLDEARKAMAHLLELDPSARIAILADQMPIRRPDDLSRLAEGLRMAGLPE